MPISGIHLIVAKKIANDYKYLNNYDFYLGCIAPDAVNVDGFASKNDRWYAHLRDKDLAVWKRNIINFYNQEKSDDLLLFLKGYITHIMTDIVYDEFFYDSVIRSIQNNGISSEDAHLYMLEEMKKHCGQQEDFSIVKDELSSCDKSYSIRNISEKLLLKWKEKVIKEKLSSKKSSIITDILVENIKVKVEGELKRNNII